MTHAMTRTAAQMAENAARSRQVSEPKGGFVRVVFGIPVGILFLGFVGLVLALLGVGAARLLDHPINVEQIQVAETAQRQALPKQHPIMLVRAGAQWGWNLVTRTELARALGASAPTTLPVQDRSGVARSVWDVSRVTASIVLARVGVALGLLVALGVVLYAALQDGLAQRELRKYGGDQESALVFQQARGSITTWIGGSLILYFAAPVAIHPNVVLSVLTPISVIGVFLSVARFKKFL